MTQQLVLLTALAALCATAARAENPFLTQGIKEFNAGDYENAAGHLGAALSTDFNDARLHYYLGNAYVHLKQTESATREFRIAYALQPNAEVGKFAHKALVMLGAESDHPAGSAAQASVSSMFMTSVPKVAPWTGTVNYNDPAFLAWLKSAQAAVKGWNMITPSGGADHSDQVPALASAWRNGGKFVESDLPECTGEGPWFHVPDWLAGTWAPTGGKIESSRQEYERSGTWISQTPLPRPGQTEIWGMAKDPDGGQIWQHVAVPKIMSRSAGTKQLIDLSVKVYPVELSTEKVQIFYRGISFAVANHVTQSATQYEVIMSYLPVGSGYCQVNESVKEFDDLGMPIRMLKYRGYLKQTQPLKLPRNGPKGESYQAMLLKYLGGH